MNYYEARQVKGNGGWHFTRMNDGVIYPSGYCQGHEPHQTKEEAEACYKKYLLEQQLKLDGRLGDSQEMCKECGDWTQGFAAVSHGQPVVLCDVHRTHEIFEKHWVAPTKIISSW